MGVLRVVGVGGVRAEAICGGDRVRNLFNSTVLIVRLCDGLWIML